MLAFVVNDVVQVNGDLLPAVGAAGEHILVGDFGHQGCALIELGFDIKHIEVTSCA